MFSQETKDEEECKRKRKTYIKTSAHTHSYTHSHTHSLTQLYTSSTVSSREITLKYNNQAFNFWSSLRQGRTIEQNVDNLWAKFILAVIKKKKIVWPLFVHSSYIFFSHISKVDLSNNSSFTPPCSHFFSVIKSINRMKYCISSSATTTRLQITEDRSYNFNQISITKDRRIYKQIGYAVYLPTWTTGACCNCFCGNTL